MVSGIATTARPPSTVLESPSATGALHIESSRACPTDTISFFEQAINDLIDESVSFFTRQACQTIGKTLQGKATPKKLKTNGPKRCHVLEKTNRRKTNTQKTAPTSRAAIADMIRRVERRAEMGQHRGAGPADEHTPSCAEAQPDLPDYDEDQDAAPVSLPTPPATPKSKGPSSPTPVHQHSAEVVENNGVAVPLLSLGQTVTKTQTLNTDTEPMQWQATANTPHVSLEIGHDTDIADDMLLDIVICGLQSLSLESEDDTLRVDCKQVYSYSPACADPMDIDTTPAGDEPMVRDMVDSPTATIPVSAASHRMQVDSCAQQTVSRPLSFPGSQRTGPPALPKMHGGRPPPLTRTPTALVAPRDQPRPAPAAPRSPSLQHQPCKSAPTPTYPASPETLPPPGSSHHTGRGPPRRERACPLLPSTTRRQSFPKKPIRPLESQRPSTTPSHQLPLPGSHLPRTPPIVNPPAAPLDCISALVEAMSQLKLDVCSSYSGPWRMPGISRWRQFLPALML